MDVKLNIEKINSLETPFYYYDTDLLNKTLDIVKKESDKYGFHVHYAVKANHERRILSLIVEKGLGADCVSGGEVQRVLECGFKPSDIVYAGVGKTDKEIRHSIENNIFCFNCESLHELEIINLIANDMNKIASVALRINPEVDPKTHAYIATGKADSKFGISYSEVDKFLEMLPSLKNIKLKGVHFHIGSQILDFNVFNYLCERVNTIVEWFEEHGIKIENINVGGGLGINYEDPINNPIPDFERYFKIFADNINLKEGQSLHFELGRSVVGQCGTLVTRVLYNKESASGKKFLIVDGSMTELIRPALYQAKHFIENISSHSDCKEKYTIAGGVCESSDVFIKDYQMPESKRGDIIILRSAGAYGSTMASNYNLRSFPSSYYSDEI